MLRTLIIIILAFLTFSCDKDETYDHKKAILIFADLNKLVVDKSLEKTEIIIPKQTKNTSWYEGAAIQNSKLQNFEKSFLVDSNRKIRLKKSTKYWSFYAGSLSRRFLYEPLIVDNVVYSLDSAGKVRAFDLLKDDLIYKKRIFPRKLLRNYQSPKIGYFNNMVFAVAGTNRVVAINAKDGEVMWKKDISAIPISKPFIVDGLLYLITNDNKIYAFNYLDGSLVWIQSGVFKPTAIFGSPEIISYKDKLLVSYSSGEIYAISKKNGEYFWSNNLNISRAINSDFYLNDIDSSPIIDDNIVYVSGNGGLMMAINIETGEYVWKKEIASTSNFWLAGNFIYLINNENKLLAIHKKDGLIKWISQLPNLKKKDKVKTKYIYNGVIMAGDKLLISRTDGVLLVASPLNGKVESEFKVAKKISHTPIVLNNKIYFYALESLTARIIEIK